MHSFKVLVFVTGLDTTHIYVYPYDSDFEGHEIEGHKTQDAQDWVDKVYPNQGFRAARMFTFNSNHMTPEVQDFFETGMKDEELRPKLARFLSIFARQLWESGRYHLLDEQERVRKALVKMGKE